MKKQKNKKKNYTGIAGCGITRQTLPEKLAKAK